MKLLDGKVAIITGASSGIGRASALLFARQGARIVAIARGAERLDKVVREIVDAGGQAVALAGDVMDEALHENAVAAAFSHFGGVHVAFNNAGTLGEMGSAETVSADGFRLTVAANLTAAFLAARAQAPAIEKSGGGSLIFTSTFVGHLLGFPGMAAYGAAKAGVIGLMRVFAVEYATRGVRVNALLPGGVDTPMGAVVADSPQARAFVENLHAMKRIAAPEEIARSALYLASDLSSFVTGSTLVADGGVTMSKT